jgi:hypothetical protein
VTGECVTRRASILVSLAALLLSVLAVMAAPVDESEPLQAVYDLNWQVRYFLRGNTLYNLDWQVQYYLRGDSIFDRRWIKRYYVKGNELYDWDWQLRYYIREYEALRETNDEAIQPQK